MNLRIVTGGSDRRKAAPTGPSEVPGLLWKMKSDKAEAHCIFNVVPLGLEVQYIMNGSLLIARRFDRSAEVVEWAVKTQASLHERGWARV